MTEATGDVLYIVHMNEAQETVCTIIHAGDMRKLWVAYVIGFIARSLLLMEAVMLTRPI